MIDLFYPPAVAPREPSVVHVLSDVTPKTDRKAYMRDYQTKNRKAIQKYKHDWREARKAAA